MVDVLQGMSLAAKGHRNTSMNEATNKNLNYLNKCRDYNLSNTNTYSRNAEFSKNTQGAETTLTDLDESGTEGLETLGWN